MIPWSYSRLQVFRECAKKFKYKFIDKLPEPGNPQMDRGNEIHKMLERYVDTDAKRAPPKLPKEFAHLKPFLDKVRKLSPLTELEYAFTQKWTRTSWMAGDVFVRIKIDLIYEERPGELVALDYKSGKIKPEEHAEQMELYALAAYLAQEKVKKIATGILYVDHESEMRRSALYVAKAADVVKKLKAYWNRQAAPLQRETKFLAQPSYRCRWCHFSKWNGGPCAEAQRK